MIMFCYCFSCRSGKAPQKTAIGERSQGAVFVCLFTVQIVAKLGGNAAKIKTSILKLGSGQRLGSRY